MAWIESRLSDGGGGQTSEDLKALVERTITSFSNSEITSIGQYAFYSCNLLLTVSLPNATSANMYAFGGCSKLTTVSLQNATTIDLYAFNGCSKLTDISVPNVTSISMNAFNNCSSLTDISLPNVTSIGSSAFSGCSKLATVVLGASTMCALSNANAFNNTPFVSGRTGGTLYVPQDLITSYQADTNWSTVLGWNANNQIKAIEGSIYE